MSETTFTGERLHADGGLFGVDLARHRAAYEAARARAGPGWTLDLGSGSGYGAASLAGDGARVLGIDRVAPDRAQRGAAHFARGDLERLPLAPGVFERIVSFQVIEHLDDPTRYLEAIASLLAPDGVALLTTPNRLMSDGVNPYHVHEYVADELAARLAPHFASVEMCGIGASDAVRRDFALRSQRIRRIVRLDPLRLRERLPRAWIEQLFAAFAVLVRRGARPAEAERVSWRDFPLGLADDGCLDLLAVCRRAG